MKKLCIFLVFGSIGTLAVATPQAPNYHVVNTYKIGGDGGWDYLFVDSAAHRLYISRGDHIQIMDTRNGSVVGAIPNTPGTHRAVIVRKHGVGFTSNGRDNTSTEFDAKTLAVIKQISVGNRPDAILYDPSSDRVFTFNGGGNDVTAIDAATGSVVGSVPLPGRPEFPSTNGQGLMFVNIEDQNEVVEFDPANLKVLNTWPIAPGDSPGGADCDAADHVVFSACQNKMMTVLDYTSGKVVATPAIGEGPDAALYDPGKGFAFSSNGRDGTLTVIGKGGSGNWVPIQTVTTMASARTMALDSRTHHIFLVGAQYGPRPTGTPAQGQRPRRPPMIPGSFTVIEVAP